MKTLVLYFGVFVIFLVKGILLFDPDLGWHLRMGQLILSKGIPATDQFSYTMPSFPFIDVEWLSNVILYLIYPYGGLILFSIIFSLLVIAILWILFDKLEKPASVPAFLLVSATFLNIFGVRIQVVSWLFMAIFLKILIDHKLWDRYKIFLPLLMILWVNLHGGFAAGVVILFLFGLIRFFQKTLTFSDVAVIFLSLVATFINPYKARMWEEVFRLFFDSDIKSEIAEWKPGIFDMNLSFWSLLLVTSTLIIYDLKSGLRKISQNEQIRLIIFLVLLFGALSAKRHMPFWVIIAGPAMVFYFSQFIKRFRSDKFAMRIIPKITNYAVLLVVIAFILEAGTNLYISTKYTEEAYYPKNAIKFLQTHPPKGQIFALYNWGGYLDWYLPEKKVFIDGRMPADKWNAPSGESNWALGEYKEIVNGGEFDKYFQKYNIETVLWPAYKKPNILTTYQEEIINTVGNSLNTSIKEPSKNFIEKLKQENWQVIYQDKNSVILSKKEE